MITASMYVAIRHEGFPRTLKELSQVFGIDRIQIAKYFRLLLKGLKIKLPLADPVNFVAKICSRAGLSKKVMLEAQKIIRVAQEEGLTMGKDPAAVAAVATYYACILLDVEVTKQDIADAADMSDVTIRTMFQALKKSITN